jgi:hypothetical protein
LQQAKHSPAVHPRALRHHLSAEGRQGLDRVGQAMPRIYRRAYPSPRDFKRSGTHSRPFCPLLSFAPPQPQLEKGCNPSTVATRPRGHSMPTWARRLSTVDVDKNHMRCLSRCAAATSFFTYKICGACASSSCCKLRYSRIAVHRVSMPTPSKNAPFCVEHHKQVMACVNASHNIARNPGEQTHRVGHRRRRASPCSFPQAGY